MPDWTPTQARSMSKEAKKAKRAIMRLEKKKVAIAERAEILATIRTALSSPVIAGTIAFLGVHFIESMVKASAAASSAVSGVTTGQPIGANGQPSPSNIAPQANPGINWLSVFANAFIQTFGSIAGPLASGIANAATGSVGQAIVGAATSGGADLTAIFANVDFTALKLAILAYIATGGNLAGLLASGGGVSGLIKTMGLGALIAP